MTMEQENDPYALTGWGSQSREKEKDLTLPSGQRCRVRMLGMEDILELDLLDAMDTFSKHLIKDVKKPGKQETEEEDSGLEFLKMLKDGDRMKDLRKTVDKVVPVVVLKPQVWPNPGKNKTPDPGKLYVKDIDLSDKFVIFSAVFEGFGPGMADFREESEKSVGAVEEE